MRLATKFGKGNKLFCIYLFMGIEKEYQAAKFAPGTLLFKLVDI